LIGNLPIAEIDIGMVLRVLEQPTRHEDSKGGPGHFWKDKPETASRVRNRIEGVLDWATARKYRHGDNPARWKGNLASLLAKTSKLAPPKHYAAVPYTEVIDVMRLLEQQNSVAGHALRFTILTAARVSEAIGARWDEVALAEGLWIIPSERTKSARPHRVPLSDRALAILEEMRRIRQNEFIFPSVRSNRPVSRMALVRLLRQIGRDETLHGFRSSFRSWAAERTNFPREIAEQALSHAIGDAVERAYQRGDLLGRRRQLMNAWERYCAAPTPDTGIVKFAKRTA
jgi:integrase